MGCRTTCGRYDCGYGGGDNGQDCCAKVSGDSLIDKGDSVTLWIDMAYISAFDMETQENITLKRGAFS